MPGRRRPGAPCPRSRRRVATRCARRSARSRRIAPSHVSSCIVDRTMPKSTSRRPGTGEHRDPGLRRVVTLVLSVRGCPPRWRPAPVGDHVVDRRAGTRLLHDLAQLLGRSVALDREAYGDLLVAVPHKGIEPEDAVEVSHPASVGTSACAALTPITSPNGTTPTSHGTIAGHPRQYRGGRHKGWSRLLHCALGPPSGGT